MTTSLADRLLADRLRLCYERRELPTWADIHEAAAALAQHKPVAPLAEFARWAIEKGCFDGCDLDGGSIQDKAENLGIIVRTQYDPEKHGDSGEAEPGDDWFVFADWLPAAPNNITFTAQSVKDELHDRDSSWNEL